MQGHREDSLRVPPVLPQGPPRPPLGLEGVRALPLVLLRLKLAAGDVEGGGLPLVQVLRGEVEGVLCQLPGGDHLALDSHAKLVPEELRQGEGGEEEGVAVEGLLVHHQLRLGEEQLDEPGQSISRVVGLVGVHTLPILLVELVALRTDLRIVGNRIGQVFQEEAPSSTSSFPD